MNFRLKLAARVFSTAVISLGLAVLVAALLTWETPLSARYILYFTLALLAAGWKTATPAFPGTISVGYLFLLVGIIDFSLPETLLLGCAAMIVQDLVHQRRERGARGTLFHTANVCIAIATSHWVFWNSWAPTGNVSPMVPLVGAALVMFAMNTFPAAAWTAMAEGRRVTDMWQKYSFRTLPAYLAGALVALVVSGLNRTAGWEYGTAALPLAFIMYRIASHCLDAIRRDDSYVHNLESRHTRIIETLGLAIEARKHSTDVRLKRSEAYAVGIGERLGLRGQELEAVRVASVLQDIGILSVPEHITSKAGRLTAEEYEKVKSHAVAGAEILEEVDFPFPIVPIVRHHHERWDGSGYPDGLQGKAIPLGARILAAVDSLSALLVNRPYRQALPREEALEFVAAQSGTGFDPEIIKVLMKHHAEFEGQFRQKLNDDGRVFAASILEARCEAQELFELAQDLGRSLSMDETLFAFVQRLTRLVSYDCAAVYIVNGEKLIPQYVVGAECGVYYSLEIPLGQGLSGTVAKSGLPLRNADPMIETLHSHEAGRTTEMRSALVVPVVGAQTSPAVLALYRREENSFSRDELRVLLDTGRKLGPSLQKAMEYQTAADSATKDALTGLANARTLFGHLDSEISRCKRSETPLSVLICDLDGFKHVNDRFGHIAGNTVLKGVARVLEAHCREYDFVARMGGDEFVIVLPGVPPEAARQKIWTLSAAVTQAADDACPGCGVSMSIGLANFPDNGSDAEQLLAHGDRQMYHSKENRKVSNLSRGYDFDQTRTRMVGQR